MEMDVPDQVAVSEEEIRALVATRLRAIADFIDSRNDFLGGYNTPIKELRENVTRGMAAISVLVSQLRYGAEHTIVSRVPPPPINEMEINIAEFMREGAPERSNEDAR